MQRLQGHIQGHKLSNSYFPIPRCHILPFITLRQIWQFAAFVVVFARQNLFIENNINFSNKISPFVIL
jgi:hypothetical protein